MLMVGAVDQLYQVWFQIFEPLRTIDRKVYTQGGGFESPVRIKNMVMRENRIRRARMWEMTLTRRSYSLFFS